MKRIFLFIGLCVFSFSMAQQNIELLPFNSPYEDEYSPFIYGSGIVFCSNRMRGLLTGTYLDTTSSSRNTQTDIYFVPSVQRNCKPRLFSPVLSSPFHEGPFSFSADKKIIYFTRNQILSKKKASDVKQQGNFLGIFYAVYTGDQWSEPKPFPYNSSQYNVIHPALHPGGKMLVFASDMPGGFGGYDLYVCFWDKNGWTKPENLGPKVNSPADDAFPFFSSWDQLFFASRCQESSGGFDVFSSRYHAGRWTKSEKLPEGINSPFDDFGYVINETKDTAFFASNRYGSDDIFMMTGKNNMVLCEPLTEPKYCYDFFEQTNSEDLQSTMKFEWDMGDGTRIRAMKTTHCFNQPGTYKVVLNVIDSLTGEIYYQEAEYLLEVEPPEGVFFSTGGDLRTGKKIIFDASQTNFRDYRIVQWQWDFGDGTTATGMQTAHQYQKAGQYTVSLSVTKLHKKQMTEESECRYKVIYVR